MKLEEATFALNLFLPGVETEREITRRVLQAIPENQADFRPDSRVRSACEMAWHLVSSEVWFLEGLIHGHFSSEEARMPAQMKTVADIVDYYDRSLPPLVESLRNMNPEDLACEVDFFGIMKQAAVTYLPMLAVHSVHHRAQIALYLRLMGAKVPSIYGGSLDEPYQSAAEA